MATSMATASDCRDGCSTSQLAIAARPWPRRLRSVWPISPVIVEALRACSAKGASMFALPAQNLFQWSSAAAMHSRSLRSCVSWGTGVASGAAAGINSDKPKLVRTARATSPSSAGALAT